MAVRRALRAGLGRVIPAIPERWGRFRPKSVYTVRCVRSLNHGTARSSVTDPMAPQVRDQEVAGSNPVSPTLKAIPGKHLQSNNAWPIVSPAVIRAGYP